MSRTLLGHVELRSGTLVVLDFGCLALFGDSPDSIRASVDAALASGEALARHGQLAFVAVRGLPAGRFPVTSRSIEDGDLEGLRRDVVVELAEGEVARTVELGTILVDTARVGLFDRDALAAWNEHVPEDGLADVAFWGGDEDAVAARFEGATRSAEGVYAFADQPYDEAVRIGRALQALRATGELRFAFDFRPHTHPFHLLARIRAADAEAGTIRVGGLEVCGWMTTWGDGWFPVELDVDAAGAPLAVRIVLHTDQAETNLRAVNG